MIDSTTSGDSFLYTKTLFFSLLNQTKFTMVTSNNNGEMKTIILSPNRSVEWSQVKLWLLFLSFPAIVIATGWLIVGVWIILPFVGLELGLLSFFMYRICYQNYYQQTITVDNDYVTVLIGIHSPQQLHQFSRDDCYLNVNKPSKPIENLTLTLQSESFNVDIGHFLNQSDLELTRKSLVAAGLMECSNRWWESG